MTTTSADQPEPTKDSAIRTCVNKAYGNCPATMVADFFRVEPRPDAPWLTAILQQLPRLLDNLAATDRKERLSNLVRALRPGFWRVEFMADVKINGNAFATYYLRTVPLFTEQEARSRLKDPDSVQWADLMRITHGNHTYYVADQFESNDTINPLFIEIVKSFRASARGSDWEIAFWWISGTGWLDGDSPRDIYREDPEALMHALEQHLLAYEY